MADNPYINKVEANNQTLIDLTGDTATAGNVLEGRTLHLASGAPATGTYRPSDEIEARLKATVGHSCKNLLEITTETQTINDVTFTVDKINGTLTANGTASAQTIFILARRSNWNVYNGYFSGCANGGTNDTYYFYAYDHSTSPQGRPKKWDGTTNSSNSYSLTDSQEVQIPEGHDVSFRILIRSGVTVNNLVFKPMLRDGSISDDTIEPYVQPTDERIVSLEARVAALEAALNS